MMPISYTFSPFFAADMGVIFPKLMCKETAKNQTSRAMNITRKASSIRETIPSFLMMIGLFHASKPFFASVFLLKNSKQ